MKRSVKLCMISVYLFLWAIQTSCNSDDDSNIDCSSVPCTNNIVTIVVLIVDSNQNPVALESFEVIDMEDGSVITMSLSESELEMARQYGRYPLITDGDIGRNQEVQLRFKGFINNQEVVNSNYFVASDCCHVGLISGDLQLAL